MMSTRFKFLSLKEIELNIVNLLAAVRAKHEETKSELTNPRHAQVNLLEGLGAKLSNLTELSYKGKLRSQYKEIVADVTTQLRQLDEVHPLTDEQKIQQKSLRKAKKGLLHLLSELASAKPDSAETLEARNARTLDDQQRAKIVTGTFLAIKKEIEIEYSGIFNALIRQVKKNTPENSVLYAGIDAAIGVTAENQLDPASEKEALAAYNQYHQFGIITNDLNVKMLEDIKDEDIKSLVSAKHKLKKVNQPVDRVGSLQMEDSISPHLLMPHPKLVAQAQNNKVSPKVKKMMAEQLAEYNTPKAELPRYARDNKSINSYLQMNEAIVPALNISEVNTVAGVDGKKDVLNADKKAVIDNTALNQENAKILNRVIAERKLKQLKEATRISQPELGKVRDANPEEHMEYDAKAKQYKAEDVAKVKAAWKGVAEPTDATFDYAKHSIVQEAENVMHDKVEEFQYTDETKSSKAKVMVDHTQKRFEAFKFFNENTKGKVEGFDAKKLKHVDPKLTHIVQVPEDYDTSVRPSFKK